MSTNPTHIRNSSIHPGGNASGLPSRPGPGRVFLGGAAIIGGLFAGTWFYMSTKQARKASREPGSPGSLPSWEYRIRQAVDPVRRGGSGRSGTTSTHPAPDARSASNVESRAVPPDAPNRVPDRSQHRTLSAGEEPLHAENGAMMHPVPQRDRGDGLAYTKRDP